jgi:hypothetical protein
MFSLIYEQSGDVPPRRLNMKLPDLSFVSAAVIAAQPISIIGVGLIAPTRSG